MELEVELWEHTELIIWIIDLQIKQDFIMVKWETAFVYVYGSNMLWAAQICDNIDVTRGVLNLCVRLIHFAGSPLLIK